MNQESNPEKPFSYRRAVLTGVGSTILSLVILSAVGFGAFRLYKEYDQIKKQRDEAESQLVETRHQLDEAKTFAAELKIETDRVVSDLKAEIEKVQKELAEVKTKSAGLESALVEAEKPPAPPQYTSRKDPPVVVGWVERTIRAKNGNPILIGIPVIKNPETGRASMYSGQNPPSVNCLFDKDSKWVKDGKLNYNWSLVEIAQPHKKTGRPIPVPGIDPVFRTTPSGHRVPVYEIWAVVKPLRG